jgi:hypothetical protein
LDGVLDNSYLENGAHLDDFRRLNTFAAPKEPTDVYLAWDDGKLYILFICGEHLMDKIKADPALPRDGPVYSTDCVEVFLDRSGQGKAFMQFVVGAGGAIYDASGGDVKWNPEYGWKVARSDAAWSAELHIPWSEIGGKPGNGDVLRMNFGRERYAAHELSMWSPQSDGFGLPEQFGSVRFTE